VSHGIAERGFNYLFLFFFFFFSPRRDPESVRAKFARSLVKAGKGSQARTDRPNRVCSMAKEGK
jgi:hypothetical protein